MNFNLTPKENKQNRFLESCINKGNNFEVEIIHWHMIDDEEKAKDISGIFGNECWNVYATIFEGHPLYNRLKDVQTDEYDKTMDNFPFDFHGGITYVDRHDNYIKLGDDYRHIGDEYYCKCKELPHDIADEAEELFKFMSEMK